MKTNRHRIQIQELRRTIDDAATNWHHDPQRGHWNHTDESHCIRCESAESQSVTVPRERVSYHPADVHDTHRGVRACAKCFPNLAAVAKEFTERLDKQRVRDVLARSKKEYRHEMNSELKRISPRFAACRFRSYIPCNESQARAVDQVEKWAGSKHAQDRFPFVLLYGNCGVGKTHLLMAARRRIAHNICIATYVNEVELSTTWQRAHDYKSRRPNEIVDEVRNASVLMLDDLGKVKPTEAWLRVLYEIINHRYEQRLPTLVSTNCEPAELVAAVGRATADRIIDNREHLILAVEGQSMRRAA